jgi:hypothetical protein
VRTGRAENLCPNAFLDPQWYLEQHGDVAKPDPIAHFLLYGAAQGCDPSPYFSVIYYLMTNPDVSLSGMNPLVHFLSFGQAEGRRPHPTAFFTETEPPPKKETVAPARPEEAPAPSPKKVYVAGGEIAVRRLETAAIPVKEPSPGTIVCITHVAPWPRRAGNEYRIGRLLDWLKSRGYCIVVALAPLEEVISDATIRGMAERYGTAIVCDRDGTVRYGAPASIDALERLGSETIKDYRNVLQERDLGEPDPKILQIERTFCHDLLV